VAATVVAVSRRLLPESRADSARRSFDLAGGLTVTAGVVVLVYAMVKGPDNGWSSRTTVSLLAAGVALIVAFVLIELRSKAPLVPMRIFRLRTVAGANAVVFLTTGAFFATLFLLTLYMQQSLGYSAIKTGVVYLPLALGAMVASIAASRLVTLCGVKLVILASSPLMIAGLYLLSRASSASTFVGTLLPAFLILAAGVGISMVALSIAAFAGVGESEFGVASGLFNTSSQVGGAVGVAVLSTVAYSHIRGVAVPPGPDGQAILFGSAYTDAFGVAISFVVAAFVITALVIRQRHVSTWKCATPYRLTHPQAAQPVASNA
jgi:predicted MFS family arabinose efflux permease